MPTPQWYCIIAAWVMPIVVPDVVHASCGITSGSTQAAILLQYKSAPNLLLSSFPQGGVDLQNAVSELVVVGQSYVGKIVALAYNANEKQRRSIALGLRAVALPCMAQYPDLAQKIPREVLHSDIESLIEMYYEDEIVGDDLAAPTIVPKSPMIENSAGASHLTLSRKLNIPTELNPQIVADPFRLQKLDE